MTPANPSATAKKGGWFYLAHLATYPPFMALAVAMACWAVEKAYPKRKGCDDGWWANPYEADMIRMFKQKMERR